MDIWIYAGYSLLLLVALSLLSRKFLTAHGTAAPDPGGYDRVEALMSPAERSLFGVLKELSGDEFEVFAKVRMADVLTPRDGLAGAKRLSALDRIVSKHFDYVLCAANDLRVLCAVELDDLGRARKDRGEHDAFVNAVCAATRLPLVRVHAAAGYSVTSLSEEIGAAIRRDGT